MSLESDSLNNYLQFGIDFLMPTSMCTFSMPKAEIILLREKPERLGLSQQPPTPDSVLQNMSQGLTHHGSLCTAGTLHLTAKR